MRTDPARAKQHSLDLCGNSTQDALAGATLIMGVIVGMPVARAKPEYSGSYPDTSTCLKLSRGFRGPSDYGAVARNAVPFMAPARLSPTRLEQQRNRAGIFER